jgi:hypothetical protein
VLTTGTGSGKSLAYFIPIVHDVLHRRSQGDPCPGISAIVIYPMNALCNSQLEELQKFLTYGYGVGKEPVTYARYTGQESADERQQIAEHPPDILLTNYVMLELIMTRPDFPDPQVVAHAQGLRFLVLDELHAYRGRQGADVAMLIRRVRERLNLLFSAKIFLNLAGALLDHTSYASSVGLRSRRRPVRYTAITGGVQSIAASNKACRSAMTWAGGRPPGRRYTMPVSGSPRCIASVPKSASCVSTKRSIACARAKIWLSVNAP